MKKTFLIGTMLAAMLLFVACKPEPVEIERDIVYTVDATTTTVHLRTDAEFDALLDRFCDYAEAGSEVTFYRLGTQTSSSAKDTKEVTTFSTRSREKMKAWMRQMEDDGKTVTVTYNSETGTYNGMAYATAPQPQTDSNWVDLGLPSGLLWATCNIGATFPTDYGEYFAWGEIAPKHVYSADNYRYCNGSLYNLTKYCFRADWGDNGFTDTLTILEPCDDAATAILGNGARIPTKEDWQELIDNTTGEWVVTDSTYYFGYWQFTAPNGNTLCLPAAGEKTANGIPYGIDFCGYYWSSELGTEYPYPWVFRFRYEDSVSDVVGELIYNFSSAHRYMGHSVRAVRPRN